MAATKTLALKQLRSQLGDLDAMLKSGRPDPEYTAFARKTEIIIEKVFGRDSSHLKAFKRIRYSPMVFASSTPDSVFDDAQFSGMKDAHAVLEAAVHEVENFWDDDQGHLPAVQPDRQSEHAALRVERICARFHLVARQLRRRHANRKTLDVKDEYDVQDLLHSLLRIEFDDVRDEEWAPSYAGGASRLDFLLPDSGIVVEAKMTRDTLKDKEIGEQLIIDIQKYKRHPAYKHLICFIYDPDGRIKNPRGIENDLNAQSGSLRVSVFVVPSGT